jgi:hypothetical protein
MIRVRSLTLFGMILSLSLGGLGCEAEKAKTLPSRSQPVSEDKGARVGDSVEAKDARPEIIPGPNMRTVCTRPKSVSRNPQTFQDVVQILNALPKPISVPCFLDTLESPYSASATSNRFSGQPAANDQSPRIFLYLNESLTLSVVPSGESSAMIEMSYRTNTEESIKGEIAFPVTSQLAEDAPYTHILDRSGEQTLCYTCHFPEKAAPKGFPATAFVSRWIGPSTDTDVSLKVLQKLNTLCETQKGDHCAIIQAIFRKGPIQQNALNR